MSKRVAKKMEVDEDGILALQQQEKKQPRKQKDESSDDEEEEMDKEGVVYLGHVPHGFYEEQMKKYFAQFGEVKNLYLSRSRKTGRSRGYAFVQFEDATVAKIAAETMNGYPLMEKVLVAEVVPPQKVHDGLFRFADQKWRKIPWRAIIRDNQARPKTETQVVKKIGRVLKTEARNAEKLKAAGIDYEFDNSFAKQVKDRNLFVDDEDLDEVEDAGSDDEEESDGHADAAAKAAPISAAAGRAAAGAGSAMAPSKSSKKDSAVAKAAASVAAASASSAAPAAAGGKRKRAEDEVAPSSKATPAAAPAKQARVTPAAATATATSAASTTTAPKSILKKAPAAVAAAAAPEPVSKAAASSSKGVAAKKTAAKK